LLDSKRRAGSFVFGNTRSGKQVRVKNNPHHLVTESDEIQEGIKMIHADRAREPKWFVSGPGGRIRQSPRKIDFSNLEL